MPPEFMKALGETVAHLPLDMQLAFIGGLAAGHDQLANDIHRDRPRGQEDQRPVLHDKVARALTELGNYIKQQ